MSNIEEYRKKSKQELQEMLNQVRQELAELQIAASVGRVKDYSQVKKTRKKIARILTILNEQINS